MQQNFASFGLLCLQGSGVTPLKSGETYGTDIVVNSEKILKIAQHLYRAAWNAVAV